MQSQRKLLASIVAALLVFCLTLTSCGLFGGPPAAGDAVVGENGADLTIDGVKIVVPAGAAPVGTRVEASFEDRNPVGAGGEELQVLAKAFKIRLGDGLQPSKPLTVTVPVDRSRLASLEQVDTSKTVAMMIQSEGASTPDLVQAVLDPEAGTISAQVPHLSWVWPVQLNLGAVMKTVRDTFMQSLGIEYPKPDCVDKPVTIGASTYRAVSPALAWLCVGESNGSLTVTASPSSPIPFLTMTAPAAAASSKFEVSAATAFSVAVAQNSGFMKKNQSVMMPGADAQYTFDGRPSSVRIGFQQFSQMMLLSILSKVIDTALNAFVKSDALETLGKAECMQNIVETSQAGSLLTAQQAAGIVKSFFACVGVALVLSPPAVILLAIISAGPQFVTGSALGFINEVKGWGNFESKIEATVAATDKAYSGSAADVTFSFKHPSAWQVSGRDGNQKIVNSAGAKIAELNVFEVWGWTGIPLMAPVVAESTYGSFSVQRPCTSCTHHVSTKVVDSTRTTDPTNNVQNPSEEVGWPKPILVSTSLSPLEQAPVSQVNVGAPSGMAVVNSAVAGGNGSKTRVVMFTSSKFFATVDEAKAWVGSAEHAQVEKMIASIRVD